ncbi:MAG: tRNA pseudouridine(13) synthase TruD [Planctomycetota bacterium]|nr:MAG: tRNA pseudouridine(13) synthase TruD [Planctomycetota bacterium]
MAAETPTAAPALDLPFLSEGIAPIPGAIKRRYEDFVVEEIPAYLPCGSGDHVYFTIEKKGLATMRAVHDIARALNVHSREIGLAGLKDARAVTVQTLSIEHMDPDRVRALEIPRIRVLSVDRHKNKLKIGHLRGNRFRIRLRETDPGRTADIEAVLRVLSARGVPNYFGQQRFGSRGDTWQIGQAILRHDHKTVIDLMLGRPGPHDTGEVLRARHLYEMGKFQQAAKAWPFAFRDNSRVCRVMARTEGRHKKAFYAIDARLKKFFVSAYQSHLFNRYLAERIQRLDRVVEGDLAYKHDHGAVFRVVDAAAEAPRAAAFEISPTGPIFGVRMTRAEGEPGGLEQAILDGEQLTCDDFRAIKGMKVHGARRPLRFRVEDMAMEQGADEYGAFVELRFTLAAGCYATMVLREICKETLLEGLAEEPDVEGDEQPDDE